MPEWWPLLLGWPASAASTACLIVGLAAERRGWFIASTLLIIPFGLYLSGNPSVTWAILLPVLPLVAAWATTRRLRLVSYLCLAAFLGMLTYVAVVVIAAHRRLPPLP
jgi:hypothetical protein